MSTIMAPVFVQHISRENSEPESLLIDKELNVGSVETKENDNMDKNDPIMLYSICGSVELKYYEEFEPTIKDKVAIILVDNKKILYWTLTTKDWQSNYYIYLNYKYNEQISRPLIFIGEDCQEKAEGFVKLMPSPDRAQVVVLDFYCNTDGVFICADYTDKDIQEVSDKDIINPIEDNTIDEDFELYGTPPDEKGPRPIRVFISHPMKGIDADTLIKIRSEYIKTLTDKLGTIMVADNLQLDLPEDTPSLIYLSNDIRMLSKSDVIYFSKDWQKSRGCRTEMAIAHEYFIPIYYL